MSDPIQELLRTVRNIHEHEIDGLVRERLIAQIQMLPAAICISNDAVDPARAKAAQDLCTRVHRIMQAPADVWAVGDIIGCLKECGVFISFYAPEPIKLGGQLPPNAGTEPPTLRGAFCLPVDKLGPAEVLQLFRAFVLKNVSQWVMGAGDNHHPLWEHVALNVEGSDPTEGPRWAYIQPLNRKRLNVLELEYEAMMDERAASQRGE